MTVTETQTKYRYDFAEIESRWQKTWSETGLFRAPERPDAKRGKFYMLVMFAYPSGDIHMGHFRNYIVGDAVARREMMNGKDVLHPFGWDAFGLPAERAAIERKLNPADWTRENIKLSRETLQKVGISFDWSREVVTCQPDYYRWSQWLFLRLFEKGLAYRKNGLVNWCPGCLTVLANEQVVDGKCERCDSEVEKKELEQWYFKITDYADRLIDSLDNLPGWPENVKTMQREWIGRSYGAEVNFAVESCGLKIPVFTTRLDTIYGVTFMALAPESELIKTLPMTAKKREEVEAYRKQALLKRDIERGGEGEEKTGVDTGVCAINPYNGEKVPIWVADYVLAHYGSGAVMGVPANDTRDLAFVEKYGLPVIQILKRADGAETKYGEVIPIAESVTINSGDFSDLDSAVAIERMAKRAEKEGFGKLATQFKLRDWLISRQRYWGTPIPIIHCPDCGLVADENLPVILPNVTEYAPKGRSPLADVPEFVNVSCPKCGGKAKRDTDTMDTFMCSAWYHLRYLDPKNDGAAFDSAKANAWLPIDKYIGGITHATGHLMYFRFMTKFLHDLGLVDVDEPASELFNHGMVADSSGKVMSKSRGNVVSPIELMEKRGVDVTRLAMYFTAPSEREVLWTEAAVTGVEKFLLNKVYQLTGFYDSTADELKHYFKQSELDSAGWNLYLSLNQKIKRATDDFERLQFNTVISAMMELQRDLERSQTTSAQLKNKVVISLTQILAPLAPHLAEELWSQLGHTDSVFKSRWPGYDEGAMQGDLITVAVQINGKLRAEVRIAPDASAEDAMNAAKSHERVQAHIQGMRIVKEIYIPGRILNIVVK